MDLLGLSMGGFIAQVIAAEEPQLVRKVILAGTGPAGGPGIDKITALTIRAMLKGFLTRKEPKQFLFFTDTDHGRKQARASLERLKERTDDHDKAISLPSFRTQLRAIHRWGLHPPADLSRIGQPVLVVNGESPRMAPSENTLDLAARLTRGELVLLSLDAGHGGILQYHDEFVAQALGFLEP
ncbi:alpha/beta hydrolase [Streptomyces sp. NPDC002130]|uniref:alpha/beta fold hydrolase n=1 Tax=Streptomyces sp. NPDC002130 TaxID=3155568 RepID=UPI0033167076